MNSRKDLEDQVKKCTQELNEILIPWHQNLPPGVSTAACHALLTFALIWAAKGTKMDNEGKESLIIKCMSMSAALGTAIHAGIDVNKVLGDALGYNEGGGSSGGNFWDEG